MKVITSIKELDNAINELQESAKSDKRYYRLSLVGEQTIRKAITESTSQILRQNLTLKK